MLKPCNRLQGSHKNLSEGNSTAQSFLSKMISNNKCLNSTHSEIKAAPYSLSDVINPKLTTCVVLRKYNRYSVGILSNHCVRHGHLATANLQKQIQYST